MELLEKYPNQLLRINMITFNVSHTFEVPPRVDPKINSKLSENSDFPIISYEKEETYEQVIKEVYEHYKNDELKHQEVVEVDMKLPNLKEIAEKASEKLLEEIKKKENLSFRSVHDKENFQAHVIEQIVHMNENGEFTTILPDSEILHHEKVKNQEVVDVLENVVFELDKSFKHEIPLSNQELVINMEIEQIDILPKDHHRESFRSVETVSDKNDKFVGFQPSEDLVPAGEETTEPDRFFKVENEVEQAEEIAEIVIDTLKYVGEYGRELKDNKIENDSSTTLRTLFETFEEVVTTISDGIKLSKDARKTIDSFRVDVEEN